MFLAEAESGSEGDALVSSLRRFCPGEAAAPGGGARRPEEVELMEAGKGEERRDWRRNSGTRESGGHVREMVRSNVK